MIENDEERFTVGEKMGATGAGAGGVKWAAIAVACAIILGIFATILCTALQEYLTQASADILFSYIACAFSIERF